MIAKIEYTEIQTGVDNKPRSCEFISFSLFKGKFGLFKCFTTTILIKVPIIIDERKKSPKENNYGCNNFDNNNCKRKPRPLKCISFSLLINQSFQVTYNCDIDNSKRHYNAIVDEKDYNINQSNGVKR